MRMMPMRKNRTLYHIENVEPHGKKEFVMSEEFKAIESQEALDAIIKNRLERIILQSIAKIITIIGNRYYSNFLFIAHDLM